jgi:molybdopterin synthase catalytic subunit
MSSLSFSLNQTVLDKRENNQQLVDIIEKKKKKSPIWKKDQVDFVRKIEKERRKTRKMLLANEN